jgi:DNA-binding NarL/FixJ family response regulator
MSDHLSMAERPVVLLVDDDPAMRELLTTIFTLHGGFRIGGVAADGLEGAMLAADLSPDVVVLDFFMPRWDGSRAAEFIRERCPNCKIVAFSAVLEKQPAWADAYLNKDRIVELMPLLNSLFH